MIFLNRLCLQLLLLFIAILAFANESIAQEKFEGWYSSLSQAQVAARQAGKPIFTVFRCVR